MRPCAHVWWHADWRFEQRICISFFFCSFFVLLSIPWHLYRDVINSRTDIITYFGRVFVIYQTRSKTSVWLDCSARLLLLVRRWRARSRQRPLGNVGAALLYISLVRNIFALTILLQDLCLVFSTYLIFSKLDRPSTPVRRFSTSLRQCEMESGCLHVTSLRGSQYKFNSVELCSVVKFSDWVFL